MTRFRTLTATLVAATALAGCTVGPNFERPAAPGASAYASPHDALPKPAPGPGAALGAGPSLAWWKAFNSPAMDALVDRAIAHNASLEASNATLAAAREQVAAARGHELPQVDVNAGAHHEEANLAGFGFKLGALPGLTSNPVFDLYSVGGGISYDLDLFGKQRGKVEQAAAQAEAQQRQTEAAHLALAGQVVNQVLTIAAIRERIATSNALLADDQRNVDLTQKRKQAGEGTLTEVLNAQAQFMADRSTIPQLEQQLDEARHLLATLIGIAPADLGPTDFDLDAFTLPQQIPVTLPSALVHKRPDILQAEADLHAATAAVGIATADLYPDVTLGGTYTQGSPTIGDLLSSKFRGFDLFAGLTAPIFHGGTLKAQKRAAIDQAKAADATYRQTVLDAFRQTADLLDAIKSDARSVANREESVGVAQHSLQLSRRSFQVGNSGLLQILDSQRLYEQARMGLVDMREQQFVNVARLYVATAGGWTGPAIETASAQ
ncbi:efflux transporter outer membrane subunit [Hephaestia mangrovi]|uniref:efflux transporter outer membrane subunit n=1 Tax=Hephaestia mangrovi TaxID=2873268 RepID=UPI001CA74AAA|nr:efflux transporter outer membrane subunit [Hephaestia mangrovi]MBY8826835.1 efflux transporter outer membrane subunit [Hephaestia mangrovi]